MKPNLTALLWGLVAGLYLRFGLEPTGWLFYELSHATDVAWLYWGYSGFRGVGYLFSLWPYQSLVCALVGGLVFLVVRNRLLRGARAKGNQYE